MRFLYISLMTERTFYKNYLEVLFKLKMAKIFSNSTKFLFFSNEILKHLNLTNKIQSSEFRQFLQMMIKRDR